MEKPIKNEKKERKFIPITPSKLNVYLKRIMKKDAELLKRLAD